MRLFTAVVLLLSMPTTAAEEVTPAVEVGHAPSHFLPGMRAAYLTITVANPGPGRLDGPITVTDVLPAGLSLTDVVGGAGWTCAGTTCSRNDGLALRAAHPPIRVVVDVAPDVAALVTNTATVRAGRRTASDADTIPTQDACPYGWSPGRPVSFGTSASGVANPSHDDGCTLLDVIWSAEPFDSHRQFVATVRQAVEGFDLTRRQRSAIVRAAMLSDDFRGIDNSCTNRIALKFDDGTSVFRPQLLELLRDKQVHGTFFDNGVRVAANPRIARFQVSEGHVQLNHTYLHVHMDQLPVPAMRDEVLSTEAALRAAGAPMTFKGVRPPFGGTNADVHRLLLEMGYTEFRSQLQVGAEDWLPEKSAAAISRDILAQLRPGLIVGLHDGAIDTPAGAATVEAVGLIIDGARARGYCFGVPDETAHVVADRYVPSERPVPRVTNPVPYHLPLAFGQVDRLPVPWVRIPSPLQVTATHAPATFQRGGTGTLTLTVTNTGRRPTDGSTVNVTDLVPAGLTAAAASGDGWTCTGTTCSRNDVLARHQSYPPIVITVNVTADAPATVANTAILSAHGDGWTDEATDTIPVG